MKNKYGAVAAGLGVAFCTVQALAEATLLGVQVEPWPGGDRIQLRLSETIPSPAVFGANQGRSVVVDLPGVTAMRPRYDSDQQGALLQKVAVATVQGVTRVVLSQNQSVNYRLAIDGASVVITTTRSGVSAPGSTPMVVQALTPSPDIPVVNVEAKATDGPSAQAPSAPVVPFPERPVQVGLPASTTRLLLSATALESSATTADAPVMRGGSAGPKASGGAIAQQASVPAAHVPQRVEQANLSVASRLPLPATALVPNTTATDAPVMQEATVVAKAAREAKAQSANVSAAQVSQRAERASPPVVPLVPVTALLPTAVTPGASVRSTPGALEERLLPVRPTAKDQRISLNFQSVDIRSVLQVIADFSGFNVVASDAVKGELTVRLQDVDWREALKVVLDAKGLGVKEQGNLLWVAPKADLLAQQESEIKAQAAQLTLEPLHTEVFRMNFAKADQVLKQLSVGRNRANPTGLLEGLKDKASSAAGLSGPSSDAASLLSARGSVLADARTNQLFVTDVDASLEKVRQFLRAVDIPVRQVMIEARIVEADDNFSRNLGVKLGVGNVGPVTFGPRIQIGNNYNAVSATGSSSVLPFVNLPASGINGSAAATFAVSLFGASMSRFLNLEISALEADGRGKVVSSPRIVTADQVKALIEQGTEYPYQTATSSGATAVEFRKANLKLEVSPQITPQGNIILDVDVNKDSRGETTAAGIAINTKHIQTQVLVENGGTLVIGGILEEYERNEVDKVPGLGDLPIIGNVFKSTRKQIDKTEVVVFITPRVINDNRTGP